MKASENLRHLLSLSATIRPAQLPKLLSYAMRNRLYRFTGVGRQPFGDTTFLFSFGAFRISPNCGDLGTIGEIFIQGPYRAFPDFIPRDGDTCLDVGANIGCVSLQWRLTNRSGLIIAVEPHPNTFSRMAANFALNRITAIEAVEAAVGSEEGRIDIVIDSDGSGMARVVGEHLPRMQAFGHSTTKTVRCLTIDRIVADRSIKRLNLLKIDVEGFEVECLKGARNTLDITDRVILEYHSEELGESCTALLSSRGFVSEVHGSLLFARRPAGGA